jgi:hypothetical protein
VQLGGVPPAHHPRKANRLATTPLRTDVSARRIILLEGTVVTSAPTAFTLELEGGLMVRVGLLPTAPVVEHGGLSATLAEGQEPRAFVSQTSDLALAAVLVFVEGPPGEPRPDLRTRLPASPRQDRQRSQSQAAA